MAEPQQWGWVPTHVVDDLHEVGDWKRRAQAVEVLHTAALGIRDTTMLLASFSAFLDFCLPLVGDPNFKIATSTMLILEELVQRLGGEILPYLSRLVESLCSRLGDNVQLVRQTAAQGLACLAHAVGPQPVLDALGCARAHPSWLVREAAVNVEIAALLSHGKGLFDYPAVVQAMVHAAADGSEAVQAGALEGLALLHSRLGPLLQGLLTTLGAPEGLKQRLAERVAAGFPLPTLDANGTVHHQAQDRPAGDKDCLSPVASSVYAVSTVAHVLMNPSSMPASVMDAASGGLDTSLAHSSTNDLRHVAHVYSPDSYDFSTAAVLVGQAALVPQATPAAPVCSAGNEAEVERSDGSLLQWRLPTRSPNTSFTGPKSRPHSVVVPTSPGTAASNRATQAVRPPMLEEKEGHALSAPAEVVSLGVAASVALPVPQVSAMLCSSRTTGPPPQAVMLKQQGSSKEGLAGANVRGSHHRSATSPAALSALQAASMDSVAHSGSAQEVEPSSGSLLVWRMPSRTMPSQTLRAQPGAPAQHMGLAGRSTPGLSGKHGVPEQLGVPQPTILQKLGSFRKKLFGPEATPTAPIEAAMAAEPLKQPSTSSWRIPAMRTDVSQHAPATAAPSGDESQPSSPGSILGKLRQLKQRQQEAAERRRVWSAPATRNALFVAAAEERSETQQSTLERGNEEQSQASVVGLRPGLQALKIRARTARLSGPASRANSFDSGALPMPDPQYSMEVLEDVFGPDRTLVGSTWSPSWGHSPPESVQRELASPGASGGSTPTSPVRQKRPASSAFLSKLISSPSLDPGSMSGANNASPAFNLAVADVSPVEEPEQAVQALLATLQAAQLSQKRELDWQAQSEALSMLRRVVRHHPAVLMPMLHTVVVAAAPVMESLRSIPARLALVVFQELISTLGPALDAELDNFVPILLKRAGVVSVAGRDNFLAAEADKAMSSLVVGATGTRVAAALLAALANTKSPDTKGKAAAYLAACVASHSGLLVTSGGQPLLQRLLRSAVLLLDEGSLESRTGAKRMLRMLRDAMEAAGPGEFVQAVERLDVRTGRVWEVLQLPNPAQQPQQQSPVRVPSARLAKHGSRARPASGRISGSAVTLSHRRGAFPD